MRFVSAQQDNPYMIWQVYVMLANFRRHGIEKDAVVLFAHEFSPSPYVQILREQTTATVLSYRDTRVNKFYTPSVYFHLVSKWIRDVAPSYPVLFHDNDIIFRELPKFQLMLGNDVNYLSDCTNYLGHRLYDPHLFGQMAQRLGLTYHDVSIHPTVGGAQYLFKHHDAEWWESLERDSASLHLFMNGLVQGTSYKRLDPWMAGMWALQWNAWRSGIPTDVHPELAFTWPTYSINTWDTTKILHNAGVSTNQSNVMFHKGRYVDRSPWNDDLSFVSRDFASWWYAQEVLRARRIFKPCF